MNLLEELKEYARDNYVPIIRDENLEYLINLIKENDYKSVLEIGSAIGYSAINFALVKDDIKIVTIERNKGMYDLSVSNFKKANVTSKVQIIFDDAFNVNLDDKFDLIFIDGAKTKYEKFFNHFSKYLNEDGIIVSDNLELKDLKKTAKPKKSEKFINKMNEYKTFLTNNNDYETIFLDIGDGFAITKRKHHK